MATETINYGLVKPAGNEYYDVGIQNGNMDRIDAALKGNKEAIEEVGSQLAATTKAEKAGGTATAIILTSVSLAEGSIKTFIVTANNNAADTKINGKPLYKPGTTSAPKLTVGKAVTVWYDAAGDCFFLKASGGGGGTALASDVVSPKTIVTEDGEEVVGTIANRGGYTGATAVSVDGGTVYFKIPKGAYLTNAGEGGDAPMVFLTDYDLHPANFLNTANVLGMQGAIPVTTPTILDRWQTENVNPDVNAGMLYFRIPTSAYMKDISWIQSPQGDLKPANVIANKTICNVVGTAKRVLSGSATSSADTLTFTYVNTATQAMRYLLVSGLTFRPTKIIIEHIQSAAAVMTVVYSWNSNKGAYTVKITQCGESYGNGSNYQFIEDGTICFVSNTQFRIPFPIASAPCTWTVIE